MLFFRLCSRKPKANTDTSYYVKGFKINYDTVSSKSDSTCNVQTMNDTLEKRSIHRNNLPQIKFKTSQSRLSGDAIAERCRISYSCNNNLISIEGHPLRKK